MSARERARSLARIAGVQAEMVKLADWRLAAARRDREALVQDQLALAALVGGGEPLGAAMAKAALRTGKAIHRRMAEADDRIAVLEAELFRLRRRDHAVAGLSRDANVVARREAEAKDLVETMEAWLARAGSS